MKSWIVVFKLRSVGVACLCLISVGLVYSSEDPQVQNLAKLTLKLSYIVLFTYLKIIFLQYF